jgi:hypothetical protein
MIAGPGGGRPVFDQKRLRAGNVNYVRHPKIESGGN